MDVSEQFAEAYNSGRLVFFVGAGASRDSGTPMPADILEWSARLFLPNHADYQDFSRIVLSATSIDGGSYRGIQPEIFYENLLTICGDLRALNLWRSLSPIWLAHHGEKLAPNQNHLAIAHYSARTGLPVFTTNFDMLFEAAAQLLSLEQLVAPAFSNSENEAVNLAGTLQEMQKGRVLLFKLHGSIVLDHAETLNSLRTTMESISAVDHKMLDLMRAISHEYQFCFVGYSGSDIDYFPVLAGMKLKYRPFWFNPGLDAVTHSHAERIQALEIDAFPVAVFAQLFTSAPIATPTTPDFGHLLSILAREMPVQLTYSQRLLFLAMCLNSIGRSCDAETVLGSLLSNHAHDLSGRDRILALLLLARVQDYVSAYSRSEQSAISGLKAINSDTTLDASERTALSARALYHISMVRQQQVGPSIRYGDRALDWHPGILVMLSRLAQSLRVEIKFWRMRHIVEQGLADDRSRLSAIKALHAMNDHLLMIVGRIVSMSEALRIILLPGIRSILLSAVRRVLRLALESGDYFVYAGAGKYLNRLSRTHSESGSADTYALLRDPLNYALVHRDTAVRLLLEGNADGAATEFREALSASQRSGSKATALKALVGLRACGRATPDDDTLLVKMCEEIEGEGYQSFAKKLLGG